MNRAGYTPRRSFLARVVGAAAIVPFAGASGAAQEPAASDWIHEVKGTHRCLFDFPQHKGGLPQLHILNYLNTYREVYKAGAGQAGAVGTFYGIGSQASIPLAFNDSIWSTYALGEYLSLKDASGKPYTRNVFYRPTKEDAHLLGQALQLPPMPALAEQVPGIGIEALQKMGTKFLLCNNALGAWCLELEARGKGKMADLDKNLRANLLPGVTVVPAMVVAIEQAQRAGIGYNRQ